jgi:hypothetical protein
MSGGNGSAPSAPGSPSAGFPTDGVPGVTPPTNPGAYWFHQIGEELRAVIAAGGVTPSAGTLTQLLAALRALFGTVLTSGSVPYGVKLGAITVQWGTYSSDITPEGAGPSVTFGTAFATACQVVMITGRNSGSDPTSDSWLEVVSQSTTGFSTLNQWGGGGTGTKTVHGFNWVAIGY